MFSKICFFVLLFTTVFILRCIYLILTLKKRSYAESCDKSILKTIIVIGSGGHTTEMLRIIKYLNSNRFTPRIYVLSDSDPTSVHKILTTEKQFCKFGSYTIHTIPRSRKVHQSYVTSIYTTLKSILYSFPVVFFNKPDLILCNGPGTCIPVCFISFILRSFYLSNNIIIFVESVCRVKTLSLTGKILIYIADQVIVQWKELCDTYKTTICISDIKL